MPSFPLPSSSGTIDLSSIKPSSTGTIALNTPLVDDRYKSDPYGYGRRDYDERSSRDRYPPPSTRYDDPYDRERRAVDPRERHGYPRDRSHSPPRRGMPDRDANEKTTDPMVIDQGYVGLVIGKGGDTLRRVESQSGARVQFTPESANRPGERLCNLIGTRRQTDSARRMIDEIIAENIALKGPLPSRKTAIATSYDNTRLLQEEATSPDRLLQIMVPDKTVGLIIGRGGENIKELQGKSGAKINIVPESQSVGGHRPINLLGEPQQTAKARELILQIVADDEAGIPISRKPPPEALGVGSRQEVVRVPQDSVGMIIGKGGETVREMQTTTQCSIKVSSQHDTEMREITLTGTNETIARAKAMIDEKVLQATAKNRYKFHVSKFRFNLIAEFPISLLVAAVEVDTLPTRRITANLMDRDNILKLIVSHPKITDSKPRPHLRPEQRQQ